MDDYHAALIRLNLRRRPGARPGPPGPRGHHPSARPGAGRGAGRGRDWPGGGGRGRREGGGRMRIGGRGDDSDAWEGQEGLETVRDLVRADGMLDP